MRNYYLTGALLAAALPTGYGQQLASASYTLRVYHRECTSCGDLEIDSGAVVVPPALRAEFVGAWQRSFGRPPSTINWTSRWEQNEYRVGNVRLDRDSTFDAMFLLPGRTRTDTIRNKYGAVYPWDFGRRYRVTGRIVGIEGLLLLFHVEKAALLPQRADD